MARAQEWEDLPEAPRSTTEEHARRKANRLCFSCASPDHPSRTCPVYSALKTPVKLAQSKGGMDDEDQGAGGAGELGGGAPGEVAMEAEEGSGLGGDHDTAMEATCAPRSLSRVDRQNNIKLICWDCGKKRQLLCEEEPGITRLVIPNRLSLS